MLKRTHFFIGFALTGVARSWYCEDTLLVTGAHAKKINVYGTFTKTSD